MSQNDMVLSLSATLELTAATNRLLTGTSFLFMPEICAQAPESNRNKNRSKEYKRNKNERTNIKRNGTQKESIKEIKKK